MKAFTQMKEAAFGDKPRERRSSAKLSDWTGPTEGTEEDGKKNGEGCDGADARTSG